MSASKFCRNFLTFPQMEARENICHTIGEKEHRNNDPIIQKTRDFQTPSYVNTEEPEHLDVPLVFVYFPESRKKHVDDGLRESTVQKKLRNIIIPQHRLSTAIQKGDPADRDSGIGFIVGRRCNVEPKDTNCSSDVAVRRVPRSSSRRATNDHGTSSSLRGHVESMDTLKLPPGSTLVSDRGVFHTKDKEKPFACGYCRKNYTRKKDVYWHIKQKHDEMDVTSHSLEKLFTCDQCGMRFRLESDLCNHKFMHSEERVFPCMICNKSYTSKRELFRHSKVHKKEECREGFICNICKKEFSDHYNLNKHMKIHTGGKPFKCSLCDKEFHVEIQFHHHMITHRETWKLLLGDGLDPEESTINVPVQFAPSQCIKQFNQDNSKTQEKTIMFASNNCTALTEQLPDNTGLLESNSHPFQLEDRQVQVESNLTMASSRLATAKPYSPLRSTNGKLMDALIKFDNSYDRVVSESAEEVDETQSSNDTTIMFNQSQGEGCSSNSVTGKRISLADGIVYEVSCSESSQCSTATQTLLVSDQVDSVTEHPSSSSRHSVNDPGTSSSVFSPVESMVSSKLPSGSTPVIDQGASCIEDKEKPFTCLYCGKDYLTKKAVYVHITQHHDDKAFSCDQCGMRFRVKDKLRRHKFTHTEEKRFPCKICNKSYTSKRDLLSHSKGHEEEECRVTCNICKKEFNHQYILKEHMKIHSGEKPFKCSFCERHFRVDIYLQIHLLSHDQNVKLLPGDDQDHEESTINVPVQVATSQGVKQFNEDNSQREQMIIQEPILDSNKCNTLEEQLTYNTGLLQSNVHPFQLEDSQIQTKPTPPTVPSGLATTDPDSALTCTNSRLVGGIKSSSESVCHKAVSESKVAIVGEPRASTTAKTKSNQSRGKGFPTKAVSGKRISIACGIVYEDEVSSPDGSRCSTTTQTLLSSENSLAAGEVPAPSSRQASDNHTKSFTGFRHVKSMVSSKLPPGSTLVSDRGVFRIKDKERPFACGYCGKNYKGKKAVYSHIRLQHDEKRYSCEFCGRSYGEQYCLKQHMRMHTKEKPYTCDQCGKSFRCLGGLRCHKFTHAAGRHFLCKVCNKSFKRKVHLNIHSQIHNREECTTGVICNICKKRFRNPCHLKNHMTIHTGEKPFKCSLCDKQFRMKMQLEQHLNIHSGLRKTCSVCGKSVGVNSMYSHMRTHTGENQTGEKRFECNICGKRFPRKPNLEGHLRSHTGEKPFACGGCNKRFALYSNMMTHKAKCTRLSENLA